MSPGPEQQREPIGALLTRLVEDSRTLAKAELALFRTDFYRRIARARTGAALCLVGAIMGQAAAVTLLVTLSFLLTPLLGRLGASAVSVALGVGLAILLIRLGVARLMLVVEDFEEDDEAGARTGSNPLDELFGRMRARSQEARNRLGDTVDETQARLHPQALIADLADEIIDHAETISHKAIDAVRRRPGKAAATVAVMLLLLVRRPVWRMMAGLGRATRSRAASLKNEQTGRAAASQDEEINA